MKLVLAVRPECRSHRPPLGLESAPHPRTLESQAAPANLLARARPGSLVGFLPLIHILQEAFAATFLIGAAIAWWRDRWQPAGWKGEGRVLSGPCPFRDLNWLKNGS